MVTSNFRKLLSLSGATLCGNVVKCESPNVTDRLYDQQFDITIPNYINPPEQGLNHQDLFATAYRCMHDVCWFKPARAYVLGLFVDRGAINRLRSQNEVSRDDVFDTNCPKSFVLFFASTKDIKHIHKGFTRSFESFTKRAALPSSDLDLIGEFMSVLDGRKNLNKDDYIRISCLPAQQEVVVSFNDISEIKIPNAKPLIDWIHSLYVGLESNPNARYRSIQKKLRTATFM